MTTIAQRNIRNLSFDQADAPNRGDIGEVAFITGDKTNWWYRFVLEADTADEHTILDSRFAAYKWVREEDKRARLAVTALSTTQLEGLNLDHDVEIPAGFSTDLTVEWTSVSSDPKQPSRVVITNNSGSDTAIKMTDVKGVDGKALPDYLVKDTEFVIFTMVKVENDDVVNTFTYPAKDGAAVIQTVTDPATFITLADDTTRLNIFLTAANTASGIEIRAKGVNVPNDAVEIAIYNNSGNRVSFDMSGLKHQSGRGMPLVSVPSSPDPAEMVAAYSFVGDSKVGDLTLVSATAGDVTTDTWTYFAEMPYAMAPPVLPNYIDNVRVFLIDLQTPAEFKFRFDDTIAGAIAAINLMISNATGADMVLSPLADNDEFLHFHKAFGLTSGGLNLNMAPGANIHATARITGKPGDYRLEDAGHGTGDISDRALGNTGLLASTNTLEIPMISATQQHDTILWEDDSVNTLAINVETANGLEGRMVDLVITNSHATDELVVTMDNLSGDIKDGTAVAILNPEVKIAVGEVGYISFVQVAGGDILILQSSDINHNYIVNNVVQTDAITPIVACPYSATHVVVNDATTDFRVRFLENGLLGKTHTLRVTSAATADVTMDIGGELESTAFAAHVLSPGQFVEMNVTYDIVNDLWIEVQAGGSGFGFQGVKEFAQSGGTATYSDAESGMYNYGPDQPDPLTFIYQDSYGLEDHALVVRSGRNAPNVFVWDPLEVNVIFSDGRVDEAYVAGARASYVMDGEVLYIRRVDGVLYVEAHSKIERVREQVGYNTVTDPTNMAAVMAANGVHAPGVNIIELTTAVNTFLEHRHLAPGEYIFAVKSTTFDWNLRILATIDVTFYKDFTPAVSGAHNIYLIPPGEVVKLVVDNVGNMTFTKVTDMPVLGGDAVVMTNAADNITTSAAPRDEGRTELSVIDPPDRQLTLNINAWNGQKVRVTIPPTPLGSSTFPFVVRFVDARGQRRTHVLTPSEAVVLEFIAVTTDINQPALLVPLFEVRDRSRTWQRVTVDATFGPGAKILINGQSADITLTPSDTWENEDKCLIIIGELNADVTLDFLGGGYKVYADDDTWPVNVDFSNMVVEFTGNSVGFIVHNT